MPFWQKCRLSADVFGKLTRDGRREYNREKFVFAAFGGRERSLRLILSGRKTKKKLSKRAIFRTIPDHPWLKDLVLLDEVDSTNTYARSLADSGACEGTVVIAERQTAGRGRMGRTFLSPAGGLYMSVILRPTAPPEQLLHLTAVVAAAVQRTVESVCGVQAQIKWTNDLVCGGKKLCGILTESVMDAGAKTLNAVIVGIGINCDQTEFDPSIADMATSIRLETGKAADRNALAGALIHAMYAVSLTMMTHKENWLRRFRENCMTVGRDVKLVRGNDTRIAHADGIGENGELLVTYDDGTQEAISSGEISVRGMYGYTT